jgi:iron complex transport system substrate-binding protein
MQRRWQRVTLLGLLVLLCCCLAGCAAEEQTAASNDAASWSTLSVTDSMDLQYATQFSVDYYGPYALITIQGERRYLVVPAQTAVPADLDEDIIVLQQPLEQIYVAASAAMDFYSQLDGLSQVQFTSTKETDWTLSAVQQAMVDDTLHYVGKYSAPDYEQLLNAGCDLAVQSTMIYHSPETMEQLESLGIPVLVDYSSYEPHPLGRMEWVKLHGLLLGKEDVATAFYDKQVAQLEEILSDENSGKTVAFFYISSNGYANVRKPGDYIAKMIALAGGRYVFADLPVDDESATSTMNMEMESFYAGACDADYIIYNSTIDGELQTMEQLIQKSPLLADFKAVQQGNAWCTEKNLYQQTTGVSGMIQDLHAIISGVADDETQLTFLHRLV